MNSSLSGDISELITHNILDQLSCTAGICFYENDKTVINEFFTSRHGEKASFISQNNGKIKDFPVKIKDFP